MKNLLGFFKVTKMRILITNTGPWGTGSFTVAEAITKEFLKMGHEVKLFFPDSNYPSKDKDVYYQNQEVFEIWKLPIIKDETRLDSFPLIIPDPHPRNPKGKTCLELTQKELDLYFNTFKEKISHIIETFQPDIIECQHIWVFDYVLSEMNIPYIAVAHHSDQMGFHYDIKMRPLVKQAAQKAQLIFAISYRVKKEVVSLYEVDESKVVVFDNGYDKECFYPFHVNRKEIFEKFELDIPHGTFLVSFAGKLSLTKGIDTLLQANKLFEKEKDIHFLILGAGSLDPILKDLDPNSYSLNNIHLLGHRLPKTVAKIHNISDITVMPSRSEGFGLSCLEAMGCALPAIVSRAGGPENYAVGAVIEKENPCELANAILKLKALSKKEYLKLSKKALEVAQEFSWTAIAQKRLTYYETIQ